MLEMLEPLSPGFYHIPVDFIHGICNNVPLFNNMDTERRLCVLLSADWKNHLFLYQFHESPRKLNLEKRIEFIQDWITNHSEFIEGLRRETLSYYEALLRFSLEGAIVYVNSISHSSALVSIQYDTHK